MKNEKRKSINQLILLRPLVIKLRLNKQLVIQTPESLLMKRLTGLKLALSATILILFTSCKQTQKIEADIWNIEPKDGSIYRRVTDPQGHQKEEFIYCTDSAAKKFKAMTDQDLKKWADYYTTSCSCQ